MNRLSDEEYETAEELLLAGWSVRKVSQITGHHRDTICKIRLGLLAVIEDECGELPPLTCECGAPHGHRGWCKERVNRSPKRKKFLARWHRAPAPQPA